MEFFPKTSVCFCKRSRAVRDFSVSDFFAVELKSTLGGKVSVVDIEHSHKRALFSKQKTRMERGVFDLIYILLLSALL